MPERIIIRKQTPPERCEICHQSDELDPVTHQCRRCANVPVPADAHSIVQSRDGESASVVAITAMVFGIGAIFPGACIWPLGLVLGLAGIVLGRTEMSAINEGRASRAGQTLAVCGCYCGIAGSIIAMAIGLLYCMR